MDFGIFIPAQADTWKLVKRAEELGYSRAWFYDTQMLTSELFVSMAVQPVSREMLIVRNGRDAVETCRLHPDIDLVLMDIKMPGIDGYDATRQIRLFNRDVIIIAQTAFGLGGDSEKALAAGCNAYISKPLNLTVLHKLIQK